MIEQKRGPAPWFRVSIIALGLLILGLGSALITMRLVIKGREVKVPSLVGKHIVYALETLNELGLGLKIADQEFNSFIAENHIISQQPDSGNFIKQGRNVKVVLSKGSLMVWVPGLEGDPLSLAQIKLKQQGLKIGQLAKTHHKLTAGKVVAQYPQANSRRARGDRINLLVSQGAPAPDYLMPDLIGLPLALATIKVKGLGFEIAQVTTEAYPGASGDTVINQTPKSGYRASRGQLVNLVISGNSG